MGKWSTTDGCVQGEFYKIFEELRGKVEGVVVITLSPDTPSAGYRSAIMAKDMTEGIPIEVVDSHDAVVAERLVVKATQNVIPRMTPFF
ncbi:MAG: DegV family protein [Dehalococcoidia bacterium]|nr:DegV family protein [Dehalococcoidia bacterium]